jgi:hypothetical protein
MRFLLLSVLCLAGAAQAQASKCTSDAQCVITTFSGCCGGCCPTARAMSKAALEADQKRCAVVDCEAPMCAAVVCEPPVPASALAAKCEAGRCVAVPKPGASECTTDKECTVTYPGPGANDACRQSACGCCPGTQPVATPVARLERESKPAAKKGAKPATPADNPNFGLSEGHSERPRPNCSPCPAPAPARAVCEKNRCVLSSTGLRLDDSDRPQ